MSERPDGFEAEAPGSQSAPWLPAPSVPPPTTSAGPPSAPPAPSPATEQQASVTYGPPWQWWTGIVAMVAGFAATAILGAVLIFAAVGAKRAADKDIPAAVNIAALLLQDALLLGAAIGLAWTVARPKPWHFGWRPVRKFWPAVGWSALTYAAFWLFTSAWLVVIDRAGQKDTLTDELGADESALAAGAIVFLVAFGAPVVEEILFRGLMFGSLRARLGVLPSAAITGVMFGLVHAAGSPAAFLLPLAVLGALLCLLYHRTGSLYAPMTVHAVNNSFAIVASLGWSFTWAPVIAAGALLLIALTALIVRSSTEPIPADAPAP